MNIDPNILRVWIGQLYREHSSICYSYKLDLDRVIIQVTNLGQTLGRWDEMRRMIEISETLIRDHPWHIVLEILKHEMAHQWVSQYYQSDDGHGPLFQTACHKLRVAPWARRAGISLGDHLGPNFEGNLSEQEQALLRKTQKLLALAGSSNEFEAQSAMRKVKELYDRYHFEQLVEAKTEHFETICINTKKKKVAAYQDMIVSLLMKYYNVTCVYGRLYDAKKNVDYRIFEITGLRHNVAMADYVYSFIDNHVNIFWNEFKRNNKDNGIASRNQFLCGVVKGFRDKLALQQKELEKSVPFDFSQKRALMLVDQKRLEEQEKYLYPRLSKIRLGSVDVRSGAFLAGTEKGRELTLHKGVKQNKQSGTLYIER